MNLPAGKSLFCLLCASAAAHALTFDEWRDLKFTAAARDDAAISGAQADPDADGLPNLLEFVLAGEPLVADAGIAPTAGWENGRATFTYRERTALDGVRISLQVSADLSDWATSSAWSVTSRLGMADHDVVTLGSSDEQARGATFLRLLVETEASALLPPTDLSLSTVSGTSWDLSWTDAGGANAGYAVEHVSLLTGEWERIAVVGADETHLLLGVTDMATGPVLRVVSLATSGGAAASTAITGPQVSDSTKAFLLVVAGQSNASGFGTAGLAPPANLQGEQPGVYYWRDVATSGAPLMGFQLYQAGVNSSPTDRGAPQMWGAEAEFARSFRAAHPLRPLYVVKSALGGAQLCNSSIKQVAGVPARDWAPDSVGELFDEAQTRVAGAKLALAASGVAEYDGAILWMQGESDASDPITASKYNANLAAFIDQARARWGLGDAPFVVGRITGPAWPYSSTVRMAQALAVASRAGARLISTDDFPLISDNKHYSDVGNVRLGESFYRAWLGDPAQIPVALPPVLVFSVQEQSAKGTVVGLVEPLAAPSPPPTFDIIAGEVAGLAINPDTGVLAVTTGSNLNHAADPVRTITVRACNGAATSTCQVTVNLSPLPETP